MELFDKLKTLGSGSFSQVFLVRSRKSRRLFAMKEITLDPKSKYRSAETIKTEVRILSKIKHPHVVTFHKSFFDDSGQTLYIMQDYCEGGTLYDKICEAKEKEEFIQEMNILKWFVQLLMAVQHLHCIKIIHRDIKSPNVFLTRKQLVKLGDFGVSRVMDSTFDLAQSKVGTPSYLSPELCQDLPYSSKSDIWALGCLLYEMCAMQPAFDAANLVTLFYKIVKSEYKPLPLMYSTEISQLIGSMLTKEPTERPSAGALLNTTFVKNNLEIFILEQEANTGQAGPKQSMLPSSCDVIGNDSLSRNSGNDKEQLMRPESEYSDDFESNSSSNSSDNNFHEEAYPKEESIRIDEDYSDDFEEYESDDSQVVLTSAKAAKNKDEIEDLVQDTEKSECKARVKEYCINELGIELYEKLEEECKKQIPNQNLM